MDFYDRAARVVAEAQRIRDRGLREVFRSAAESSNPRKEAEPMTEELHNLVLIVDRSGSMQSVWSDAVGAVRQFVKDQQAEPGRATLKMAYFHTEYVGLEPQSLESVAVDTVLADVSPRGMTALLDAIGRTIDDEGRRLAALPEEERPTKTIVVIQTDGLENSSTDFTKDRVKEMVEHQSSKYGWEFIYLGANQDAIQVGGGIGVRAVSSATYDHSGAGVKSAYRGVSSRVSNLRRGGDADDESWKSGVDSGS